MGSEKRERGGSAPSRKEINSELVRVTASKPCGVAGKHSAPVRKVTYHPPGQGELAEVDITSTRVAV